MFFDRNALKKKNKELYDLLAFSIFLMQYLLLIDSVRLKTKFKRFETQVAQVSNVTPYRGGVIPISCAPQQFVNSPIPQRRDGDSNAARARGGTSASASRDTRALSRDRRTEVEDRRSSFGPIVEIRAAHVSAVVPPCGVSECRMPWRKMCGNTASSSLPVSPLSAGVATLL